MSALLMLFSAITIKVIIIIIMCLFLLFFYNFIISLIHNFIWQLVNLSKDRTLYKSYEKSTIVYKYTPTCFFSHIMTKINILLRKI